MFYFHRNESNMKCNHGNIKKTIKTPSKFLLISVPPTMSHKSSRSKKNQMIICKKVKRLLCTEHTCLVYGFFLFLFFVLLICFFLFHRFCFNLNNSHLIRVHFQINSSHIESFIEKPKKISLKLLEKWLIYKLKRFWMFLRSFWFCLTLSVPEK